jgi:type IX secretion system PorP/SprF family membrane protein
MMINKLIIVFKIRKNMWFWMLIMTTLLTSLKAYSQQLPNYTQYLYNMQIINPAYVGVKSDLSISLLSRQQWVGVEGAPSTSTFSINGRTSRGLGIGTTIVHDRIGLSETTNLNLDGSYTIITSRYSRLSFGLKAGVTFFNNNLFNGITPDNDIYNSISGRFPNVGIGTFFYNRKFFVGFSIPYLLETPQFYIEENYRKGALATNLNYFFSAGVLFKLSDNLMFKPSTMVRYTANLPISIDINSNLLYKEFIEAGLSYRYQNSVSALFSVILNEKFRVGYSYDYKTMNLGSNLSSHEIILHLNLDFKRNTRWLRHNKCYF